jgi:hypothetical protein
MHATAAVGSGSGGLVVTGDYGGEHGCRPRAGRQQLGLERGHVGMQREHGDGSARASERGWPQRQSWSRKAGGLWRVMGQLFPEVQRMQSGTSRRVYIDDITTDLGRLAASGSSAGAWLRRPLSPSWPALCRMHRDETLRRADEHAASMRASWTGLSTPFALCTPTCMDKRDARRAALPRPAESLGQPASRCHTLSIVACHCSPASTTPACTLDGRPALAIL